MINKIKRQLIMIEYFTINLLIIFSMPGCNWQNHPAMSDNINESKKRKVFISEYSSSPTRIDINDTLYFDIKNAWLEKKWKHGNNNFDETILINGYQLIMETNNKIPDSFDLSWTIGIDYSRYIRTCGIYCLITDFEHLPIAEKEVWKVRLGKSLKEEHPIILGDFILYRKK